MSSRPWFRGIYSFASRFWLLSLVFIVAVSAAHADPPGSRWAWMDGPNVGDQPGVYGSLGVPAPANNPGARQGAATWKDAQGNLWLFGGFGYDKNGVNGFLNDLWKYDVATGQWAGMKGSDVVNGYGTYGGQGNAHPNYRPGARYRPVCWTDTEGRFWLFGGYGYATSGATAGLNDVWMYDPNPGSAFSGNWAFMKGTSLRNEEGVFGMQGEPATANRPPNLSGAVGWADASGNLWLFGGLFYPDVGSPIPSKRNDLWRFDIENRRWTWMKGTAVTNAAGVYGTMGNGTNSTRPGARFVAHAWTDAQGRFWLFGGHGYGVSSATDGFLQDLWRYDPQGNIWTWIKGTNGLNQYAKHGDLTIPSNSNVPGGMTEGVAWTDVRGDLWLSGGAGHAKEGEFGELSALWRYEISANGWTWMNGSDGVGQHAVFGTPGSFDPLNTPGGIHASAAWVGAGNRLWLFGGEDYDPSAGSAFSSALWQLAEEYGVAVTGPNGPLGSNATFGFGVNFIGTPVERTFTILNSGLTALTGLNAVLTPIISGDFTLVTPPAATLAPGESTTFTVRFTATHVTIARANITIDEDSLEFPGFSFLVAGTGTPPVVTMGVAPEWAWEDAGTPFVFTFIRTGSTANPLTFNFTVSGEATFGVDYTVSGADTFSATAGSITIPAGSASASVQVMPTSETVAEDEEIVRLNIEGFSVTYAAGWPNLAEAVIASEELVPGGRDRTFYPKFVANTLSTMIVAVAAQPDGKILIGGTFEMVNDQPRNNLARLHPDGTLDATFNASLPILPQVNGVAVQPDGRIVIIGCATGTARFLADGTPDPAFTPLAGYVPIYALALQPDGKILIGGNFTAIHGVARANIARLNADGTLDAAFDPGLGADADVHCITVQLDGKILVGGSFATFDGQPRSGIVRIEDDGDVDTTFDPGTGGGGGTPMYIASIAVQPDGRIVAGGDFFTFNDEPRNKLVRLLPDGSLDPDFAATAGPNYGINSLALQADGKIVVGGYFDTLNGQAVPSLGRLNADGTLDTTFQATSDITNGIFGLTLLADGRVLSVGQPSIVDETHSGLTLRANQPATQTLRPFSGNIVNWLRGGSAPELTSVFFELSTDGGANWTPLGVGERTAGGWRENVSPLPITGHLRARGTGAGGLYSSSASVHEQIAAFTRAPEIVVEGPGANIVVGAGDPGPWGNPTLSDGTGTVDFGLRQHPVPPIIFPGGFGLIFIVHNVGNDDLTGFDVVRDGDHPGDFFYSGQINQPGATIIAPGAWKAVTIGFGPQALGQRNASLHILSSDADEPSFDVALTGFGASRREMWRHTHFGTIAGTGSAADTADPDADGDDNNLEFLAGLNPNDPNSRFVLRLELVEGEPTQRKILFSPLTFTWNGSVMVPPTVVIKYRTSLTEDDWLPLETTINWATPEWWAIDTDAGGSSKFYRVEVTGP